VTEAAGAAERMEVHSSRWWALIHFSVTRWLFPQRMIADHVGISTSSIRRWFVPWERTDEHLPFSHIAEVSHIRGLIWDAISIESSGGLNPLTVRGLPKSHARYFVDHVRERINTSVAAPPPQQQRR
jgi:hypothetical protein